MTDTLRSICEQCSHLNNPELDFVSDDRTREIIRRDLGELVLAASLGLEKAVIILAGSIFESVLCGFLKGKEQFIAELKGSPFTFPLKLDLQNYVNIFNAHLGGVVARASLPPYASVPPFVVDYRNFVHINCELDSVPGISARASQEMLRELDKLLGALSGFAGPQSYELSTTT